VRGGVERGMLTFLDIIKVLLFEEEKVLLFKEERQKDEKFLC
jgi:hypothetical protein